MSADIWIKIEDYQCELPAMEDEILFVVLRFARNPTEDALIRL
jgi:hypothetical protein